MKGILIILDGVADLPCIQLHDKTPLEAADTPNLDAIAAKSELGYMYPVKQNYAPESDTAVVSILGNDPFISERGQFETIGTGITLERGDLALRTNFATINNIRDSKIIDRRAGRTLTTKEAYILAKTINKQIKLDCKFIFQPTVQHRGVLVLKGGFSDNITNTDPSYHVKGSFKEAESLKMSQPLDDDEVSQYSSDQINKFIIQSYALLNEHPVNNYRRKQGFLPANILLTRDPGIEIPKLKKLKKWAAVTYMPVETGIAKAAKMSIFSFSYPRLKNNDVYRNLYEGLNTAMSFSIKVLKKQSKKFDYFYIHLKETDIPGHDNKPLEKKAMIELIDKKFFSYISKLKNVKLIITADHTTSCNDKSHTSNPVPVLFYDPKNESKKDKRFTERESRKGSLKKIIGKELLTKLKF